MELPLGETTVDLYNDFAMVLTGQRMLLGLNSGWNATMWLVLCQNGLAV